MARTNWTPPKAPEPVAPPPERPPATIKAGWVLPDPPTCPRCGGKGFAAVHHTGDSWVWGWDCDNCGPDEFCWNDGCPGAGEEYDWPFKEDVAWAKDWKRAGVWEV